jgi:hypothetical protein
MPTERGGLDLALLVGVASLGGSEKTMAITRLLFSLLLALPASGCAAFGAPMGEAPLRSPSYDYPEPAVETSDGHHVGADRIRVEDKLQMSPRVGTGGVIPAETPPAIEQRHPEGVTEPYDPICKVLGASELAQRERCRTTAHPEN